MLCATGRYEKIKDMGLFQQNKKMGRPCLIPLVLLVLLWLASQVWSIGVKPREGALVVNENEKTTVSEYGSVGVNGFGAGMGGGAGIGGSIRAGGLVALVPALMDVHQLAPELGLAPAVVGLEEVEHTPVVQVQPIVLALPLR